MTHEDRDLLLKDIYTRIPYGVKGCCEDETFHTTPLHWYAEYTLEYSVNYMIIKNGWRPYLFPLSSMTEEQKRELLELTRYEARCEESCGFDSWGFYVNIVGEYKYEDGQESIIFYPDDIGIDWLNKNHFDYRGLIEKGLAIDATGKNIY